MQVRVRLFAAFREFTGIDKRTVETRCATVGQLYAELCLAWPGLQHEPEALFAVNDRLCEPDQPLNDGDEVLLFPPVAGG